VFSRESRGIITLELTAGRAEGEPKEKKKSGRNGRSRCRCPVDSGPVIFAPDDAYRVTPKVAASRKRERQRWRERGTASREQRRGLPSSPRKYVARSRFSRRGQKSGQCLVRKCTIASLAIYLETERSGRASDFHRDPSWESMKGSNVTYIIYKL